MREFSTAFAAHLESGGTSLCACWLIIRTDDVTLGFTDHDQTITFDGINFEPANGLEGSEIAAKLGAQVDTSEITGILHSQAISEDDIEMGRYNGASVKTYWVNWRDVSMRELLRIDTIGEIVREDLIFRAELRSQQQQMNVPQGRRYQSQCDVLVGAPRCGINIEGSAYKGTGTVSEVKNRFLVEASGLSGFAANWFSHGTVYWQNGKRIKITDRVIAHANADGIVSLSFSQPVGDWVEVGDAFFVFVGCDRRYSTCKSKFSNSLNFQGFPHIPGNDFVLSVPKSGDDYSGSALIK